MLFLGVSRDYAQLAHHNIFFSAASPREFAAIFQKRVPAADAALAQAERAGANIVKPAHNTFWGGYAGYFLDHDGHVWEVVWNPHWSFPV